MERLKAVYRRLRRARRKQERAEAAWRARLIPKVRAAVRYLIDAYGQEDDTGRGARREDDGTTEEMGG